MLLFEKKMKIEEETPKHVFIAKFKKTLFTTMVGAYFGFVAGKGSEDFCGY